MSPGLLRWPGRTALPSALLIILPGWPAWPRRWDKKTGGISVYITSRCVIVWHCMAGELIEISGYIHSSLRWKVEKSSWVWHSDRKLNITRKKHKLAHFTGFQQFAKYVEIFRSFRVRNEWMSKYFDFFDSWGLNLKINKKILSYLEWNVTF